jgi:hypothetical protein
VECPAIVSDTAAIEVVCETGTQVSVGESEGGETRTVQHLDDDEKNFQWEGQQRHCGGSDLMKYVDAE